MIPDLEETRRWIQVAEGQLDDDQLARIMSAEQLNQKRNCRVPLNAEDYPDDLAQAFLRRCARAAALRGVPLGIASGAGDGSNGTSLIAKLDSEIHRYENNYPRLNGG